MKNFLLSLALITGFAACNDASKQADSRDIQLLTDSTAYHNNFYSDTSSAVSNEPIAVAQAKEQPRVITITKRIIYTPAKTVNQAPVYQPQVITPPVKTTAPIPEPTTAGTGTTGNTTQAGNDTSPGTVPASTTTQTEKKKGWSTAAKGAVIGAGAGAIGGAIISKKKGLGAIVGGVVGAAGGYIIGKDIDKRKAGN